MILNKLIELGYLDANIKSWGKQALAAQNSFKGDNQIDILDYDGLCLLLPEVKPASIKPSDNFTENIINELLRQGFFISRGENRNNIIYIRGCNLDGTQNNNSNHTYNDLRLILIVEHDGYTYIKNRWMCAIDFGERQIRNYQTNKELFQVVIPQQTWAWIIGLNVVSDCYQEGLAQVRPIAIYKISDNGDIIQDYKNLGINQYGGNIGKIGRYCAEPLAGEGVKQHEEFIDILKTDVRYLVNKNYVFATSFLDGFKCSVLE